MAIVNGYTDLSSLKARLSITDTAEDAVLEAVIEAASRAIDGETGRVFYAATATRYFTAEDSEYGDSDTRSFGRSFSPRSSRSYSADGIVFVDDLLSVTSLKTDQDGDRVYETTWAVTDYDLEPYNSLPYTRIQVTPRGTKVFPNERRGVEVTGSWGYAATAPDAIAEACLLMAARLFKRKDAPFGVLANQEFGSINIPRLDPDVKPLLRPYVRMGIGAV